MMLGLLQGIRVVVVFLLACLMAVPAGAATLGGLVSDATGAVLPGTRVVIRDVATGQESSVETGADGRFRLELPTTGTYLMIFTRYGFSETARTITVTDTAETLDVSTQLEVGRTAAEVSVTAARASAKTV